MRRPVLTALTALPALLTVLTLGVSGCGTQSGTARGSGSGAGSSGPSSGSSSTSSSSTASPVSGATSLDGRRFAGTTAIGLTLARGTTARLGFDKGVLSVDAGCNRQTGGYTFDGSHLRVTQLTTTELACPPGLAAQDSWLRRLLSGSPAATLTGSTLTIGSPGHRLVVTARTGEELLGTSWTVRSTSTGSLAIAIPKTVHPSLTFAGNGQHAQASLGCNSGGFTISSITPAGSDSGVIVLRPGVMTMMACQAPTMAVEHAVLAVLTGTVHYQIDGDTLTLRNGRQQLSLRSQAGLATPGPGPAAAS